MAWSHTDRELLERIGEVLYSVWDPIGVSDVPAARGEYDAYRDGAFSVLARGGSEEQVVDYLEREARPRMGLGQNRTQDMKVAALIVEWSRVLRAPTSVV